MPALNLKSKKAKTTIRLLSYVFFAFVAVISALVLLFAARGYDIDRDSGEIFTNGLILVDNTPESAGIFINGQYDNDDTPGKLPLPEGDYNITLLRDGYREWSKDINLEGSDVVWLYYPKLFPTTITAEPYERYSSISDVLPTPDGRFVLVQTSSKKPVFSLVNLDDATQEAETLTIPASKLSTSEDGFGTFKMVEWNEDSNLLLVRHKVSEDMSEYILFDTEDPSGSTNLTNDFDLELEQVQFRGGSNDVFFAKVNNSLRRLSLNDQNASNPLVNSLITFDVVDSNLVTTVTESGDESEVGIFRDNRLRPITKVPRSSQYFVDFKKFESRDYMAVGTSDSDITSIFRDPLNGDFDGSPLLTIKQDGVEEVLFSATAEYISVQSEQDFNVYDIDEDEVYTFNIDETEAKGTSAEWMDGHRLQYVTDDNRLLVFEFDGANLQDIGATNPKLGADFDRSFEVLFTYNNASNGSVLMQQSNLLVESN